MEIFLIILLSIIIIALIISIRILSRKIDVYEKITNDYNNSLNQVSDWMNIALKKLHDIDRKQIFEGDDDVGWFFQTLKYQITELNNKIAEIFGEEDNAENSEKEKK